MCQRDAKKETLLKQIKKRECLEQYAEYALSEGRLLNSGDVTRIDRSLYRRILQRFGSWTAFQQAVAQVRRDSTDEDI
jgi:hypothetical protein